MHRCTNCSHTSDAPFKFCPSCGIQQVGEADAAGLIGHTFKGKYRILKELGAGSMGTVYLAEHVSLKKRVAIKVLHKDLNVSEETLQRFQREGIAAGQVNHPHAIQIFDFDRDSEGHFFLAMEYVEGQSLKELLTERGSLTSDEALHLSRQLLSTLVEAHQHGIVHRDLKPENLMVVRNSAGEINLKVLDFGLSKLLDRPVEASLQTRTGRVMGTPMYMAPEQWNGEEADQRTDLYATALILYEMLVGKQPFRGSNLTETFVKTTTESAPSLADSQPDSAFPEDLEEVLQRGLQKSRDERFQSAQEMLETIEHIDPDRIASARRIRGAPPRRKAGAAGKRPANVWMVAGAVVVLLIAVPLFAWIGGGDGEGTPTPVATGGGTPAPSGESYPLASMAPATARTAEQRTYISRLESARSDLRSGNDTTAMITLNQAIGMPEADAEAFLLRAEAYRRQGEVDVALGDLRDALRRYPRYAAARAEEGWIHFERGDLDQAAKDFQEASELDGDRSAAQAGIGAVLCEQGEHDQALQVLQAAAGEYPESALVYAYLGRTQLALDMSDEALVSLVDARRMDQRGLTSIYEDLAEAYLRKGDERAAEQQLRVAIQGPNPSDTVRTRMANLLLGKEDFEQAAEVLEPIVATSKSAEVKVMWGLIELGRGSRVAAIDALRSGLNGDAQETGKIHELLGTLMLEDQRWADARRHCQMAYRAGNRSAGLFATWGVAQFHLGLYPEAAENLEKAVGMDERDLFSRYTLGVIYMDYLMQSDKARQHFREYRRAGGDDPKVEQWLRRLGG